ncbi:MAG: mannose-6-phosphate isomerase, partial [Luteolibacter sp.]
MRTPNYDKYPAVAVPNTAEQCVSGWDGIAARLSRTLTGKPLLVVECYPGVDELALLRELTSRLNPALVVHTREAMLPAAAIDALVAPFLGGDDPVFGFLTGLQLPSFFDPARVETMKQSVASASGLVIVVGCGARLIAEDGLLVYADLARWEAQLRFRRNEAANLGVDNHELKASLQYKRAFFIDWRVADRWKRPLIAKWDFLLDTNNPAEPKLAAGEAVRRGLREAVSRPFRVVPFFDPAPWGGQWMKEACDLDRSAANYGWCFDCVPEENSLLLEIGDVTVEMPSINLVFDQPRAL